MTANEEMKSNRIGLSEHTARRLAELRARRAEADDTGGISFGATSSTAAAEATVNDGDNSTGSHTVTAHHGTTPMAYGRSDSNTAAQVLPATQLPSKSDVPSSLSNLPKPASHGISAPTTAVLNGISEGSPDTTARHEQSWNVNMESNSSINRQELSNARAATEASKQRREVLQPSSFMRTGSHPNDATKFSGRTAEVGGLNKMVGCCDIQGLLSP